MLRETNIYTVWLYKSKHTSWSLLRIWSDAIYYKMRQTPICPFNHILPFLLLFQIKHTLIRPENTICHWSQIKILSKRYDMSQSDCVDNPKIWPNNKKYCHPIKSYSDNLFIFFPSQKRFSLFYKEHNKIHWWSLSVSTKNGHQFWKYISCNIWMSREKHTADWSAIPGMHSLIARWTCIVWGLKAVEVIGSIETTGAK